MTPLLLAVTAVTLAWPVPRLVATQRWLRRTPVATIVLWQSLAVAAVLAALGAGLSLATDTVGRPSASPSGWLIAGAAVGLSALVAARLLLSGHRVGTELRRLRRRHREQVDLVAARDRSSSGLRLLDSEVPVAYCLPQMRGSRIVVTSGALSSLAPDEVDAVLAHERAHLRVRHDLVLEAFVVLQRAFPQIGSSRAALDEVGLLIEMAADRAAARVSGRVAVARALAQLAQGRSPEGALGAGGAGLPTRVERLTDPHPHRVQAVAVWLVAATVVLAPSWWIVWPWLAELVTAAT